MSRQLTVICCCVLALLGIPACDKAGPDSTVAKADGEVLQLENPLFDSPRVIQIALEITPPELGVLKTNNDSHAYVRCTVREGGQTLTEVGIHCKGDPVKEFASGRPDFTIRFDKFVKGQALYGQRRLILQSSKEDPSYLSAPVGFELFREAGVPAPRCGFARLELNGQNLGLYVINEGVNRDFLRRHFKKSKGELYVYDERQRDDTPGIAEDDDEDDQDKPDLIALGAAAHESDAGKRWEQLRQQLDMDRFLAFTALEVLLWKQDAYGYSLRARKVRVYHDPSTDRLVFFPKGVEIVLEKTDGPLFPKCKGDVADAVLTAPEGRKLYRGTVAKLLGSVFAPEKVQKRAREIAATIRPAIADDAAAAQQFDAAVARFCDAVAQRAAFAAEQLKAVPVATPRATAASSSIREE